MTNDNYSYLGVSGSWFPIRVKYEDGKEAIVHDPKHIKNGVGFKILENRVKTTR